MHHRTGKTVTHILLRRLPRRLLRHVTILSIVCAAALASIDSSLAAENPARPRLPNIVFILADDIGYGDLAATAQPKSRRRMSTALAREGIRFTDAHATGSVCTPTRYAFITGQYAWRNPAGAAILDGEAPLAIDPTKPTTASILQAGRLRHRDRGQMAYRPGQGEHRLEPQTSSPAHWSSASTTPSTFPPRATACRACSSRTTESWASIQTTRSRSATSTKSATSRPAASIPSCSR